MSVAKKQVGEERPFIMKRTAFMRASKAFILVQITQSLRNA